MLKSTYASRYVIRTRFMVLLYHNICKFVRFHVPPLFSPLFFAVPEADKLYPTFFSHPFTAFVWGCSSPKNFLKMA
jgi:hypothetical protein